jgi:hypothetical protein
MTNPKEPVRRIAEVTIYIEYRDGFVGVVEGSAAGEKLVTRSYSKTLPEDVVSGALLRAERLLRQQLKENF